MTNTAVAMGLLKQRVPLTLLFDLACDFDSAELLAREESGSVFDLAMTDACA